MKKLLLSFCFLLSLSLATAQEYVRTDGNLDVKGDPGSSIMEKKYIPKIEGSKLLLDDYYDGAIWINGKAQENRLNIDLSDNTIVFRYNDDVRQLNISGVDSVVFNQFKVIFRLADLRGCLLEYGVGSKYKIVVHKSAALKESDYNKSLDVGSRDDQWVVKEDYYLIKVLDDYFDETYGLREVPSSKKKFADQFNNPDEILNYIKANKIRLNETEDLVTLFTTYSAQLK